MEVQMEKEMKMDLEMGKERGIWVKWGGVGVGWSSLIDSYLTQIQIGLQQPNNLHKFSKTHSIRPSYPLLPFSLLIQKPPGTLRRLCRVGYM